MNSTGVLDDYLEELLGDAVPVATAVIADMEEATGVAEAIRAEFAAGDAVAVADVPATAPAFDTPTSPGAPAAMALLEELLNDPALGPVAAPVAAAPTPPTAPPSPRAAPPVPAPVPSGRPSSWQELQAQARNPASSPRGDRRASERTSRWLRLRCGAQAYALELLKVQEVVLPVPLLPLRGTPSAMLGIMNLRGQVVPVMDLGIHLGAGPARDDANTRIVVLEEDGETMGLRVSAVEDVANLTDSQIEPPDTARICQISNDLFRGVARVTAQPMILLDATQLLN